MGSIYLVESERELLEMQEQPYEAEKRLQQLLASHPRLLSGDRDTADGHSWVLVSRELSVTPEGDGTARWSVDHLFLDQEGVPTLVEVKRSTDTRIRREVIGQMLDYAANAVLHWPIETVRGCFEKTCEAEGAAPEEKLATIAVDDVEAYWLQVKTNLKAGRIRLIFVADVIPAALRRVVEFLNEQMDPAEVLALEVRQFVGAGRQTLVPRLLGRTAQAERAKGVSNEQAEQRRTAIYQRVAQLLSSGVSPDEIIEAIGFRPNWIFCNTEGHVNSDQFIQRQIDTYRAANKRFVPGQWFCGPDELFRFGGKTYALSRMWAGRTPLALANLAKRFGNVDVTAEPS